MADREPDHNQPFPTEADIEAVIYELKGDAREAIRALLHDLAVLAGDYEADVSRGFVRSGIPQDLGLHDQEAMMGKLTYYAVLPFVRTEDGELCPDEAIECHSSTSAAARARAMAASRAGAVAFSRTGDPDVGDYVDAVIITTIGDVPADLAAATGA